MLSQEYWIGKQLFGFIDSNVILFVAMFIVGGALFETGMANKIGGVVTHFAKTERQLIIAIMVIVGLMSGVLSNTGTAAVLIPVVIGIAAKSGILEIETSYATCFAAAMGGNLSLIGAPGNLIAQSAMGEIGLSFGFFEYAKVGLPILIAGILYFAFIGYKFLPEKQGSTESSYDEQKDFSNVPKWKQMMSLIILILTLLGMIFEDKIGIKLCVIGCVGALALIITGVISEKNALKSIDLKTIFLIWWNSFTCSGASGDRGRRRNRNSGYRYTWQKSITIRSHIRSVHALLCTYELYVKYRHHSTFGSNLRINCHRDWS